MLLLSADCALRQIIRITNRKRRNDMSSFSALSSQESSISKYRDANSFKLELLSLRDVYFAANSPEIQLDIDALFNSVREHGFDTPLKVRKVDSGTNRRYEIIDGKARWICAHALGIKTVPAAVFQISDDTAYWRRVSHYYEKPRLQRA
jgi:hypothetical protein